MTTPVHRECEAGSWGVLCRYYSSRDFKVGPNAEEGVWLSKSEWDTMLTTLDQLIEMPFPYRNPDGDDQYAETVRLGLTELVVYLRTRLAFPE